MELTVETWSVAEAIWIFIASTAVITVAGTFLSKEADRLADLTGFGEALVGAIFLGAVTSLSGFTASFTAAIEGHPHLSVSNAIGGIAAQTVFLAIADITYPKVNLEHAAASLPNVMQAVLLILLLTFMSGISVTPEFSVLGFHPGSLVMILAYIIGQNMISRSHKLPMWRAVKTVETREDVKDPDNVKRQKLSKVIMRFCLFGVLITLAGYFMAHASIVIVSGTTLSESVVGATLTGISSSIPELIVSIAAVRQGALTLAVSNIIGGNTFDVLFVAFSDFAYSDGSIMHTFQQGQLLIINLTILLTAVLTLGLLHRQKKGIGSIGWESFLILVLFFGGYTLLFLIR